MSTTRFGEASEATINVAIDQVTPINTKKSNGYVWKQFHEFCGQRGYELTRTTPTTKLALIMKDWGYNMKQKNVEDYKESVIKTMWNVTAKQLQKLYFQEFGLDEDTPDGLERKFYYIASYELAWRGGEAAVAEVNFFHDEVSNSSVWSGRIEYNPVFSKTAQGGGRKLADSKWLVANTEKSKFCPVRLFKKLLSKRGPNVTTNRLFLTPKPLWRDLSSVGWYKNSPVGKNQIGKWTKSDAKQIGVDTTITKITNHSLRSSAVSHLARGGVGEEQLIKITGHASTASIKPYLQLDSCHHAKIIGKMRNEASSSTYSSTLITSSSSSSSSTNLEKECDVSAKKPRIMNFYNCTFHSNQF
ncbi:uncharacterized protein LOC116174575 [Photinus pyralis]|uniref:uncharacterized protein LOC116166395 n=1 Tax=Photinus pyralis TaxID=7054 RepID=UPI00126724D1|nr:uncharacterized protein LOC116166395 [Photinus pyralis]XP_031348372.1 uncharacterized protein LOC116174575 [Photinus pyralis]